MDKPHIEGYSDLEVIGRGGFSVVYRARQERLHRPVALKVLLTDTVDERAHRRFERECRAVGELSWHPHVVAVHDSGVTDDGRLWLAMELLEAGSLADRVIRDGPIEWPEAVDSMIQVAGALGAAHAIGTLHRDLKPANMLVGPFGEAKLGDFGIAALGDSATTTGGAAFTIAHVAPEVLRGAQPDVRSDIYGLASTLHTLIAGASPFTVEPGQPLATAVMQVLETDAPRLEGVPDQLAVTVLQALAKRPDDRPQTARAIAEALQSVQRSQGLAVTTLRLTPTKTDAPVPAGPEPGPPTQDDAEATVRPVPPLSAPASQAPPHGPAPPAGPPSPAPAASGPSGAPSPAPAGGRRRALVVGGAVLVVAIVGTVVALLITRDTGTGRSVDVTDTTNAPAATTEAPTTTATTTPATGAASADVAAFCDDVDGYETSIDEFVSGGDPTEANDLAAEGTGLTQAYADIDVQSLSTQDFTTVSECARRLSDAITQLTDTVNGG